MHDLIFENQYHLNPQTLLVLAESLKLNMDTFQKDIQDPKLAERVDSDFESGIESGVNGTPSFYINAVKYDGSYDFLSISNAVGKEFSGHPKKHPGN
jgi:protein-disulfide isomerase